MFLKHSLFYLLAKVIPALASFITLAAYTRMLTPSEFGVYTVLLTAVNLVNTVLFYWLVIGILRYWHDLKDKRSLLISTTINAYLVIIALALCALFIAYFSISLISEFDPSLLIVSFGLLVTMAFFDMGQQIRSANLNSDKYAITEVTRITASVIITLPLLFYGFGIISIFIGLILANILTLVLFSKGVLTYQAKVFDKDIFSHLRTYGLPLAVVFVMGQVIDTSDRFLLSYLINAEAAGMYAVGYNLPLQAIMTIAGTLNLAGYPVILKSYNEQGKEVARELLEKYFQLFISLMVPTTVGLVLVGPNLIKLIIGEAFQEASLQLLPWISVAIFIFVTKAFIFDLVFHLTKKTKLIAWMAATAALLNIALNFWLIPKYGYMGAVYATITSYSVGLVLSIILGRPLFAFSTPLIPMIKIITAAGVMALFLYLLRGYEGWLWLILQSVLGAIIYLIMALLLDITDSRKIVKDIMNKVKPYYSK